MQQIQFVQITPEQLQNAIIKGVNTQLNELKEHFQPKEPTQYMTRLELAEWLKVDISTIHNWTIKNILKKYAIEGRVYYKRAEVEKAIIEL